MKNIFITLRLFVVLSVITGVVYPLLVTQIGQRLFPKEASGSLIIYDNEIKGSELVGQNFTDAKYFWPRPSATNYNALPSGGSNLGPTSAILKKEYEKRKDAQARAPVDLLFASGSGLDPHISPESASYQASRVAIERGLTLEQINALNDLIDKAIEKRDLGVLGDNKVNVLKLNIMLNKTFSK